MAQVLDCRSGRGGSKGACTKIFYVHIRLAKDGYSTGGQPPYGFRRWLVNESVEALRELEKGETKVPDEASTMK